MSDCLFSSSREFHAWRSFHSLVRAVWVLLTLLAAFAATPFLVAQTVTAVASGNDHTMVLKSDGTLWAVGANENGELGTGSTTAVQVPVQIATGVVAVAAGGDNSAFIKSDGTLWSMGRNDHGQVGDGTGFNRSTPVQIAEGVASVSVGGLHLMFVKQDGSLWGTGWNGSGELGDGTTTLRYRPTQVATDVASVAAGGDHTVFVKRDGTAWAMGGNAWGQLADGTNTGRTVPTQIAAGVAAVHARLHTLLLKTDGTLWTAGRNESGQLGDGTTVDRASPVRIAMDVVAASVGASHTLFLRRDGTLWAMGRNSGELGEGSTVDQLSPIRVASDVAIAAAGSSRSLFVKSDGTLWATGSGDHGELWDGTTRARTVFVQVLPAPVGGVPPTVLATSGDQIVYPGTDVSMMGTFAGSPAPTLQWTKDNVPIAGANSASYAISRVGPADAGIYRLVATNQFGRDVGRHIRVTVRGDTPTRQTLAPGELLTIDCGLAVSGTATYLWYHDGRSITTATGPVYLRGVSVRDSGAYWCVVQDQSGTRRSALTFVNVVPRRTQVIVWGGSGFDLPSSVTRATAVALGGSVFGLLQEDGKVVGGGSWTMARDGCALLSDVAAVTAMYSSVYALAANGTVTAWDGWAGIVPWYGVSDGVSLASSDYLCLVLTADGRILAKKSDGTLPPTPPATGSLPVAIAAGEAHALALCADGTVVAWGNNGAGQATVPAGLQNVLAIAAGSLHSLALKSDGTVVGWGDPSSGASRPPSGLTNVVAVAAGLSHSLALKSDGTVVAWGTGGSVPSGLGQVVKIGAHGVASYALRDASGDTAPAIVESPQNRSTRVGGTARFSVNASGGTANLTYQWRKNGVDIAGATQSTLTLSGVTAADEGQYDVVVTNYLGRVESAKAALQIGAAASQLVNISARAYCSTGNSVTIGGFVVTGNARKQVLIRAVGPSLASQGIGQNEVLLDPTIEVYRRGTVVARNDDWGDNANAAEITRLGAEIGANPLATGDTRSSALLLSLDPGVYSFIVKGKNDASGIVLLEIYDAETANAAANFVNISARGYATTGNGVAIGGFVIGGTQPKQVLMRAVGPTLTTQGIGQSEVLVDPTIELYRRGAVVAQNDDWTSNANQAEIRTTGARIGATPFADTDTHSSALLMTLDPGVYSFIAKGRNDTSGIVLVEVYDAD